MFHVKFNTVRKSMSSEEITESINIDADRYVSSNASEYIFYKDDSIVASIPFRNVLYVTKSN